MSKVNFVRQDGTACVIEIGSGVFTPAGAGHIARGL
jgi:hypothetical protein